MPASAVIRNPAAGAAIVIAIVGAAAILGAFFFQYGLGLEPCPLCLEQRIAYYFAIPLALIVAFADSRAAPRALVAAALVLIALAMLLNAGLGVYHAGVEWKFWPGPTDCAGQNFHSTPRAVALTRSPHGAKRNAGFPDCAPASRRSIRATASPAGAYGSRTESQ